MHTGNLNNFPRARTPKETVFPRARIALKKRIHKKKHVFARASIGRIKKTKKNVLIETTCFIVINSSVFKQVEDLKKIKNNKIK